MPRCLFVYLLACPCLFVCFPVYLSVCFPVYVSVCLFLYLSLLYVFIYLPIFLSVFLCVPVCMSACLPVYLSVMPVSLPVYLTVMLVCDVCLCVTFSACLTVYLYMSFFLSLSLSTGLSIWKSRHSKDQPTILAKDSRLFFNNLIKNNSVLPAYKIMVQKNCDL